jgi:L-lactate dehydrogenase complex protein LldG
MDARETILEAVRRAQVPAAPLPPAYSPPVTAGDLLARFGARVRASAGEVLDQGEAGRLEQVIPERYPDARVIASAVPGLPVGNFALAAVTDPHELADIDLLICEGAFGVAENGAVWLPESSVRHRAAPFLAQHLLVMLERHRIVRDMHEACARIPIGGGGFGVFVAGPSKTADIEQALVIGAHGPRSLTILLV